MDIAEEQHALDRRYVVRQRLMGYHAWRDLPAQVQDELADEIADHIVRNRLCFTRIQCQRILSGILKDSVKIQE